MKKISLLLLATTLTIGAIAQNKNSTPKEDTVDVSNVKVIKAGTKYYQVVYLYSPDQTIEIYKILNDCIQNDFPSSIVDPIKQILLTQIPPSAKQ